MLYHAIVAKTKSKCPLEFLTVPDIKSVPEASVF